MKETKRVFRNFQYRQCGAFSRYLEEMARKGWYFETWGFGLIFRRGEPREAVYAVEVFPDGREGDLRPTQNTKEYADYCEAAGWKFLDGKKKFCIFRREREEAVPIVEPEERMDNVICAQRKQQRQELAGNTLIALIYWYSFYHYTFDVMFAVMPFVLVLAIMGVTALINGIQYIGLEMWVKRIRQEWKSGKKEPDYVSGYVMSTRWGYSCFTLLLVSMAAYWTEMAWIIPVVLVWFGLIFLAQMIVEMVRPDREIKWILIAAECVAMLVLFYIGFFWMSDIVRQPVPLDLPLVCEDLWPGQETAGSDSGIARSFLGSRLYYYCPVNDENLVQIDNGLWYDRYDSRYGWVLDRIWEIKMQDFDGREMNPSEIQKAETVWESRDRTRWLVRYPDRIVNLESAQVLDYSEFQLVWEAFGNGSDN